MRLRKRNILMYSYNLYIYETNTLYFYTFYFTLSFSFFVFFVIFPFPSDESKTPEYIFSQVEARKTLWIFFYLLLSFRKKGNSLIFPKSTILLPLSRPQQKGPDLPKHLILMKRRLHKYRKKKIWDERCGLGPSWSTTTPLKIVDQPPLAAEKPLLAAPESLPEKSEVFSFA